MVIIANLQYGWTYFVDPWTPGTTGAARTSNPFDLRCHGDLAGAVEGWFVDRFGPRLVVMFRYRGGHRLVAQSTARRCRCCKFGALSGVGAGAVYGTCVGNALKWFADRRGLAAGLTAAGFGAGAAATVVPIINVIKTYGYESAFLWFGIGQGAVILALSQFLKAPAPGEAPKAAPRLSQSSRDYSPGEMLQSPIFWILYAMFVLVAASGLVVTAQVAPIAKDYGVGGLPVNFLFVTSTVLVVAGIVDNILNGLARPTFGWVSDQIGRENTMAIVFTAGAGAYWALGTIGNTPWTFIMTAGLVYFTWGEIYSLFPATCTDTYGSKYAATNAGLLYTAKGAAAFLVPAASWLQSYTGGWHAVFVVATIANLAVAATAFFIVKPMRAAHHAQMQPAPRAGMTPAAAVRLAK